MDGWLDGSIMSCFATHRSTRVLSQHHEITSKKYLIHIKVSVCRQASLTGQFAELSADLGIPDADCHELDSILVESWFNVTHDRCSQLLSQQQKKVHRDMVEMWRVETRACRREDSSDSSDVVN